MTGQLSVALRAMGHDPAVQAERVAGSASGSEVFRVVLGSTDAVVKVTTVAQWRAPARNELRCYRELVAQLPVATPRLLDWVDNDDVTAMLLSAHSPAAPAADWTEAEWLEAARQLGELHTRTDPTAVNDAGWLLHTLNQPPPASSVAYWQAAGVTTAPFDELPEMAAHIAALPTCLLHGDCHVGNLLRADDGTLIWADWQGVRFGHGIEDLTSLWSRATTDGGAIPYAAMLSTYAAVRAVDPELLRRAAIGAEMNTLLTAWPEYAPWIPPEARDRLTCRLLELMGDWKAVRETVDPATRAP